MTTATNPLAAQQTTAADAAPLTRAAAEAIWQAVGNPDKQGVAVNTFPSMSGIRASGTVLGESFLLAQSSGGLGQTSRSTARSAVEEAAAAAPSAPVEVFKAPEAPVAAKAVTPAETPAAAPVETRAVAPVEAKLAAPELAPVVEDRSAAVGANKDVAVATTKDDDDDKGGFWWLGGLGLLALGGGGGGGTNPDPAGPDPVVLNLASLDYGVPGNIYQVSIDSGALTFDLGGKETYKDADGNLVPIIDINIKADGGSVTLFSFEFYYSPETGFTSLVLNGDDVFKDAEGNYSTDVLKDPYYTQADSDAGISFQEFLGEAFKNYSNPTPITYTIDQNNNLTVKIGDFTINFVGLDNNAANQNILNSFDVAYTGSADSTFWIESAVPGEHLMQVGSEVFASGTAVGEWSMPTVDNAGTITLATWTAEDWASFNALVEGLNTSSGVLVGSIGDDFNALDANLAEEGVQVYAFSITTVNSVSTVSLSDITLQYSGDVNTFKYSTLFA